MERGKTLLNKPFYLPKSINNHVTAHSQVNIIIRVELFFFSHSITHIWTSLFLIPINEKKNEEKKTTVNSIPNVTVESG